MTQQNRLNKYFEFKCWKGFEKRGLEGEEYVDRLKFEIEVIERMGFPSYFLIVADFLDWARKNDIPVGPGRGSAAGSLASYCISITDLDPIRFGLLFERFLNPDRISLPDIDCDFCEEGRNKVIKYVIEKYGRDRVAQIGTFGRMKARAAVRMAARKLDFPVSLGDMLSKMLPPPEHGKPVSLAKSYEMIPEIKKLHDDLNSDAGLIFRTADKIEDAIQSYGIHAAGVVISPVPLTDLVPLTFSKDTLQSTQFDMDNIEDIGLVKLDFLGLKTLTVIKKACDLIKQHHGVDIDINNIVLDDPLTFSNLREGDTIGIFQLETSSGIRDLMIQIIPREIEDIFALVAMYRPGPLASDGLKQYLQVRAGKRKAEYPFPELEPILGDTAGWIIYQEQCMSLARVISGYTRGHTDDLRKAIGKKIPEKMAKHESTFIDGGVKNGFDRTKMEKLWEDMVSFADYGFNMSHAAAYGYITYQTAYLKAHFPVEFMTAALMSADKPPKVIKYVNECKKLRINVLPPDVNESDANFTIIKPTIVLGNADPMLGSYKLHDGTIGGIRFGLAAVKNLGNEPVLYITDVRSSGFRNIVDFSERVNLGKINKKKLESLVLAGAFDSTGDTRSSMLSAIDAIMRHKELKKRYESKLETYNKKYPEYLVRLDERENYKELGIKKPGVKKEPVKPTAPERPVIPDIPELSEEEILSYEKELIGFFISGHPLDAYTSALKSQDIVQIENLLDVDKDNEPIYHGKFIALAGVISSVEEKVTKKGDTMAFVTFEDKTGIIDVVVFPGVYRKCKEILKSARPLHIRGEIEVSGNFNDEETELTLTVKIKAFVIKPLISGEISYEPIKIEVTPNSAKNVMELINKYEGSDHKIIIIMKTNDGTNFHVKKVYSIGGNRSAFLRELGRI